MLERFRPHYLKLGPRRFVVGTVITLLVLDVLNCYYLKLYFMAKRLGSQIVHSSISLSELQVHDFSRDTVTEMSSFINNSFDFLLVLVVANNLFFYLFYLKQRLWAQGYVLFYTLTAALFSLTFVVDPAGLGAGWLVFNVLTIFVYAYLYVGVKVLRPETTLEGGRKGR